MAATVAGPGAFFRKRTRSNPDSSIAGYADIYCGRTGCLCSLDLIQLGLKTHLGMAFLAARYLLNSGGDPHWQYPLRGQPVP